MAAPSGKRIVTNGILLLIIGSTFLFYAYSTGITGVTQKNGFGCQCHGVEPSGGVTVTISGPDELTVNETGTYSVTISGGPLVRGGTNVAASTGNLTPGAGMQKIGSEITHTLPKVPDGGVVTFEFTYTAPATEGAVTLYANGNSVNFSGNEIGDQWNFAPNKTVTVAAVVPVELTAFSASVDGNNVKLNWKTATETNNSGYEVHRASGKSGWEKISYLSGAGTSAKPNEYYFEDKNLQEGKYSYRLKQIDFDGSFTIYNLSGEVEIGQLSDYVLNQNYPNPFNPSTNISFNIPQEGNVSLKIYNSSGEEVSSLENGFREAGFYSYKFNADNLASGIYFYNINVSGVNNNEIFFNEVKKMILLK